MSDTSTEKRTEACSFISCIQSLSSFSSNPYSMLTTRTLKHPFTAAQWQELEHQALLFHYISSGIAIPSHLILPITRPTRTIMPQFISTNMRWGAFRMDYGRKAEDPEPWRCRRTDGKKWRCSKEAYTDSKYCERHMHRGRGKNRSRKPVEMMSTLSGGLAFSQHDQNHVSFETSMGESDSYWEFRPLEMSSLEVNQSPVKQQRTGSHYMDEAPREKQKQKHCFVLGADFMLGKPSKGGSREEEDQKPDKILRCFLDEGPVKTQLSISTPM